MAGTVGARGATGRGAVRAPLPPYHEPRTSPWITFARYRVKVWHKLLRFTERGQVRAYDRLVDLEQR